ncbi:4'-phosphopantetheinyl transferase superfamily protein [Marinobacter sp. M216]|uniref:4'-phosphopantetheinyl transferase superfamily protein n=1 Tax=Marinobacter albus TaxID=3030833 RepID=A0ABT7HEM1_9GAMM|nr:MULTISPECIES: 4'-phosphopantetheinyl transferase superfamily protein [unclassified Marinobacter]MBW7471907.1 4'-phosphopantetheinyl transferase superfamily protein [Marinobacter sp. F4218]MDK9558477.1 4'-phosphopantetheinyl transferase superfamily protein [Marinobacter sp. M216]
MAGSSSACSPDPRPAIWLCREGRRESPGLPDWLTDYERETAAKFSGPRKREYLSSRWLIRRAIAGASGLEASDCRPVNGRPVESAAPVGWHLSLSHSHGLSACATSPGQRIGLDLEPCTRHPHWQRVARRWFTPREQAWLLAEDCPETFLRVWTLKEAWLKATGRGIAGNLQTLEVGPGFELRGDQNEPDWQADCWKVDGFLVTLVFRQTDPAPPALWRLGSPPDDFGLAGTGAVRGAEPPMLRRRISPATRYSEERK